MYRGREGQWAFVLHRLSGVAIALYLLLHVVDISLVMYGPDGPFDRFLAFYHKWPFRIGLILVMAGVAYHAFNGLRIIVMDFSRLGGPLPAAPLVFCARPHHPDRHPGAVQGGTGDPGGQLRWR